MGPIFTIAGIALGSTLVQKLLEETGHGSKTIFISISGYVACALVGLDYWWDGIRYVARTFGVMI